MQPNLRIETVSFGDVSLNPWNPHGTTLEEMQDLIDSISSKGIVDTPTVVVWDRPINYEDKDIYPTTKYLLVDGEQRYKATKEAFISGARDIPGLPVTVLGNASEFTDADLAELGEALNHRGRGSLEDVKKTGIIANWLAQRHAPSNVAKLMGKNENFVAKAMAATAKQNTSTIRPQGHQERKALNIVLPFEDEMDVEEFELLLAGVEVEGYYATKGLKRTAAVMKLLRDNNVNQLTGQNIQ